MKKFLLVILLAVAGTLKVSAQANLGFTQGLKGWQLKGRLANFGLEKRGLAPGAVLRPDRAGQRRFAKAG